MTFRVCIDDNYRYMDAGARRSAGEFGTYEEAEAAAEAIVERSLRELCSAGMSVDRLMAQYVQFGEDPFIVPTPDGRSRFSARDYASKISPGICDDFTPGPADARS